MEEEYKEDEFFLTVALRKIDNMSDEQKTAVVKELRKIAKDLNTGIHDYHKSYKTSFRLIPKELR